MISTVGDEVGAIAGEVGAIPEQVGAEITKVRAIISQVRSETTKFSAFATIRHASPIQKAPLKELSSNPVCHSTRFRSISSNPIQSIK